MTDSWTMRTRPLAPLKVGDSVFIQNQEGNYPRRWDKRGQVVKVKGYDQYIVRVDGSRRLTRRSRKFLRKFEQYRPDGMNAPQAQTPQQGMSGKGSSHLHFPPTSELFQDVQFSFFFSASFQTFCLLPPPLSPASCPLVCVTSATAAIS